MQPSIVYRNHDATRNLPLSDRLVPVLLDAAEAAGVEELVVYSGGQPSAAEDPAGEHRTGSTRHDHGNAADLDLHVGGRALRFTSATDLPVFKTFVAAARQLGALGIGAGVAYMGPTRLHVGFGSAAIWGHDRTSATAPDWLREAYYGETLTRAEVIRLQTLLRPGYPDVGAIDGDFGSRTLGALNRMRIDNGLPPRSDHVVTEADWSALARADAPPVAEARATVTERDLREAGSRTVTAGRRSIWAMLGGLGTTATGYIADASSTLQRGAETIDQVRQGTGFFQAIRDGIAVAWPFLLLAFGIAAFFFVRQMIAARVDDQRTGKHA